MGIKVSTPTPTKMSDGAKIYEARDKKLLQQESVFYHEFGLASAEVCHRSQQE